MLLLKTFMEFDVLFALFLLLEILVPTVRSRPRFPACRWAGRTLRLLPPLPTPGENRVATANERLREAQDRLKAAEAEVSAADLEQKARALEAEANKTPRS
jgi:hypothetical protein